MREVHGRPGPVGPNTDPNADWISNGVTWSPALASAPNNCQQTVPRGQQWLGYYHKSNNTFYLYPQSLNSSPASSPVMVPFGSFGSSLSPVSGNWTGDGSNGEGFDKLGVYDTSSANFYLCTLDIVTVGTTACANPANIWEFQFGNPGTSVIPVAGRWSPGASHDGIGIYQTTNDLEYMRNQLNTGFADYTVVYGSPGDVAIVGDWTGNGVDTPGIYRHTSQVFYLVADELCNCTLYSDYAFQLGSNPNTQPVAGDWLGDGYSSVGVYDNSFNFTIQKVLDSDASDLTFGPIPGSQSGDIPVAGRWLAGCTLPPGNSIQSGRPIVCQPNAVTATTTLTPTYVPTLPPNFQLTAAGQTATAALTYVSQNRCVLQANQSAGTIVPLMNNDLATIAPNGVQISPGSIFVPQYGRGATGNTLTPNANYIYYGSSYYGQPGWIYTGYGFAALGNSSGCSNQATIPAQVENYQVPSTLAPAPVYVPTSAILPTSTLDCPQTLSCTSDFTLVRGMYDQFVAQFTTKYGRPPTVRDILAITAEMEWASSISDPNAITYGSEGFARNYYNDCRRGTCTSGGLNVFLSAYSEWFQGMPLSAILNNYTNYLNNAATIDPIVDNILMPVLKQGYDPTTGYDSNRPWQWFSYVYSACSNGTNRSQNDSPTGVFYRVVDPVNNVVFEIYTGAQNSNIQAVSPFSASNPCRYTPTPTH